MRMLKTFFLIVKKLYRIIKILSTCVPIRSCGEEIAKGSQEVIVYHPYPACIKRDGSP